MCIKQRGRKNNREMVSKGVKMFRIVTRKIASFILKKVLNNKNRLQAEIVNQINKKIDIPRLNEAQEKELISAVIDAIIYFLTYKAIR